MASTPPPPETSRRTQVIVGFLVILVILGVITACWLARFIPGMLGESFGILTGLMTTPFLMEGSLMVLGMLAVLLINYWRQRREGDELVYLERAEGPGSEELPESSRWAIYRDKPLDSEVPEALFLAEGALEIGDYETSLESLTQMSDAERDRPAVLDFRIKLARATGKDELADRLEAKRLAGGDQ